MTYFNFFNFNRSIIKSSVSLLLCFCLFACSSIKEPNYSLFSETGYARGYVHENFSTTRFTPTNKEAVKKSMPSDHELMLSLLNRPITADHAMMLAFEKERRNYGSAFSNYAVEIKGEKDSDKSSYRTENVYTRLISQDINSISIIAPN